MMIDLLRTRRSIRRFTARPLDRETIDLFAEALLRSPSSRGINPWEFIFATEKPMLEKLSHAKVCHAEFLAGAALAVVILGNEETSDVWIEDCSIAAIIVQLLATDLGLGSCWAQLRNRPHDATISAEAYVRQLLGIPEHLRVGMIIGVGYPGETKMPLPSGKLDFNKIHQDRYRPRTSVERAYS
ncbi:MAG: nitroreductase family protein [Chitinispirillaceae bacterium]|nr:nitroreductase family protein [Chitinispirillaceae bacterium]